MESMFNARRCVYAKAERSVGKEVLEKSVWTWLVSSVWLSVS